MVATTDDRTNEARTFTSEHIFRKCDQSLVNGRVAVVMVPDDSEIYHVDTTFLDTRHAA